MHVHRGSPSLLHGPGSTRRDSRQRWRARWHRFGVARSKHFLGVPAPAATLATINLTHVVAVVEFTAAEFAMRANERDQEMPDEIEREVGADAEAKVAALQVATETMRP